MTPEQLAADRAVCDAAPGPTLHAVNVAGELEFLNSDDAAHFSEADPTPLTRFVTAARTRWPAALDEVERLRAENAELKDHVCPCRCAEVKRLQKQNADLREENATLRERAERIVIEVPPPGP